MSVKRFDSRFRNTVCVRIDECAIRARFDAAIRSFDLDPDSDADSLLQLTERQPDILLDTDLFRKTWHCESSDVHHTALLTIPQKFHLDATHQPVPHPLLASPDIQPLVRVAHEDMTGVLFMQCGYYLSEVAFDSIIDCFVSATKRMSAEFSGLMLRFGVWFNEYDVFVEGDKQFQGVWCFNYDALPHAKCVPALHEQLARLFAVIRDSWLHDAMGRPRIPLGAKLDKRRVY